MGRADARRARQSGARRGKPKKSGIRRLFTWKKMLGTFLGIVLLGMAAFIGLYLYVDVPKANAAADQQSNVYKLSNGKVIARTGEVNREKVGLDQIPLEVQRTFVAAENKSFYDDNGIDLKGLARGLYNTASGKGKQGGSTITQQYVKNYYLSQDQTVTRKLNELVISLKVDRKFTKKEILAGYINTSYYGRQAYGIQAASQAYYGIDAKKLNVAQGAYLASLLQAPSQYDWQAATPEGKRLVTNRWNYTLDNMVEKHWLDASERASLKVLPKPRPVKAESGLKGETGYLVKAAKQEMVASGISEAEIDAGGWTITLNIDAKKQAALEKTIKQQVTDKLKPKSRKVDADLQAGAVSVDPHTGAILALYGGQDYLKHEYSNAKRTDYQPASTFKPLILAAALENNAKTQDGDSITADTRYSGKSRRPVEGSDTAFAPPNEDNVSYGNVNVQTAMNKSINSVFAQMGVDVGLGEVRKLAVELGLSRMKTASDFPAMTLGSYGASPMEMAGAYATFDNHGKKVTPTIVKTATHANREPYSKMKDAIGDQVVSRSTADALTSVMTGVVDEGTGTVVKNKDQQVAGKTGTSDNNKSAWFTGYTPNLVTSVGLFGEAASQRTVDGQKILKGGQVTMSGAAGSPTGRINGGGFPAQIWAAYTFGLSMENAEFDLDTDQGAAVAPTYTPPVTPSETPSETPSHTTSRRPSNTPSQTPSETPSETPVDPDPGESSSPPPDPGQSSSSPNPGGSQNAGGQD
ncbi:transglycosylase domain-containing protein [Streptomyces beijiangensis]|uniref:Penicillin-binding protein n=1 Tax=Streptomyces beijiangensis TaxID=163361 RepID=A0A939JI20_9ACTN|nr:transglycosylase domain-containing protein [Streptomyces beijiangensis]MBO0512119.1 penicillin-binding protein [Streptomyces beijiangensis]